MTIPVVFLLISLACLYIVVWAQGKKIKRLEQWHDRTREDLRHVWGRLIKLERWFEANKIDLDIEYKFEDPCQTTLEVDCVMRSGSPMQYPPYEQMR
jgi:hypothetical protein